MWQSQVKKRKQTRLKSFSFLFPSRFYFLEVLSGELIYAHFAYCPGYLLPPQVLVWDSKNVADSTAAVQRAVIWVPARVTENLRTSKTQIQRISVFCVDCITDHTNDSLEA